MIRRGLKIPTPIHEQYGVYWRDPVPFFRQVLKVEPWDLQERIARTVANHRRVAVRSCHNSGKTWLAGGLATWFLSAFEPSLVISTAGTELQVKGQLWKEIEGHYLRGALPGKLNKLSLELSPTQRAVGFTTNRTEFFQGWHCENILVIVDEASGVNEAIYQAIEGILTSPNAHLLLIGNPNSPSGTFYNAFSSPLYEKFHISAFDVPEHLLPPRWKEERLLEWGEDNPAYQVRVLGNFPDQGDDSLIRMSWVTDAQERHGEDNAAYPERDDALPRGDVEMGVDIARYGSDESVAYVRRGGRVIASDVWRGSDTTATAGRIVALARRYAVGLIKIDDIGVGAGPTDQVIAEFRGDKSIQVIGVNVGEAAWDGENYFNRRMEIFQGLADRFKQGDISIPKKDTLLLAQLVALKYSYTPKGQKKLESKEDMKKRLGSAGSWNSPDRADALALAFATVRRRPIFSVGVGVPRVVGKGPLG